MQPNSDDISGNQNSEYSVTGLFKTLLVLTKLQIAWKCELLICVWLFATSWTVVRQATLSMGFSRQDTGEEDSGSHSLLQGIFLTQGLNPCLLHCRQILYHLSHQRSLLQAYPLLKSQKTIRCKLERRCSTYSERQIDFYIWGVSEVYMGFSPWGCKELDTTEWTKKNLYLFIWLHRVLAVACNLMPHWRWHASSIFIVACGIFSCGMGDLVTWPSGSPALGSWSLSHWTTGEVPAWQLLYLGL